MLRFTPAINCSLPTSSCGRSGSVCVASTIIGTTRYQVGCSCRNDNYMRGTSLWPHPSELARLFEFDVSKHRLFITSHPRQVEEPLAGAERGHRGWAVGRASASVEERAGKERRTSHHKDQLERPQQGAADQGGEGHSSIILTESHSVAREPLHSILHADPGLSVSANLLGASSAYAR